MSEPSSERGGHAVVRDSAAGSGAAAANDTEFRGLLEAAPDAIVIIGPDGRILLVNARAHALFGYERGELAGQPVEMLLPERFRGSHVGHRTAYNANPHTRPMGTGLELYGRRKDGGEFPVEVSLSPVTMGGRSVAMSAIRDITDRKEAEDTVRRAMQEAERANQAKSEFLSRMSHELRTPLNSVLGFAQLLSMDPLSEDQQKNVGRILRAGRHLLDLINEVLDIARIESGRLPLSPEPVRLGEAVREALELVRPLAAERDVHLHAPLAGDQGWSRFVLADRQRLKQIFLNLLSNAVKYNRPGGRVDLTCTTTADGQVRVSVADTGPGIPAASLDRIFSPFERLGAETTEVEGTGLGLALSQGLAQAMGGRITVDTAEGAGSTFSLELLPAEDPLKRDALAAAGAAGEATVGSAEHTILYVEDNLSNLELIEQILARMSQATLISAMQGRMGVELATKHRPDLVLLDLHLPDISGLEVLQALKADPRTREIPVVIVSADATRGQEERLLAAGAREYLTKPLDVQRFLDVVNGILVPGAT